MPHPPEEYQALEMRVADFIHESWALAKHSIETGTLGETYQELLKSSSHQSVIKRTGLIGAAHDIYYKQAASPSEKKRVAVRLARETGASGATISDAKKVMGEARLPCLLIVGVKFSRTVVVSSRFQGLDIALFYQALEKSVGHSLMVQEALSSLTSKKSPRHSQSILTKELQKVEALKARIRELESELKLEQSKHQCLVQSLNASPNEIRHVELEAILNHKPKEARGIAPRGFQS